MAETTWYRVEIVGVGDRFIEVNKNPQQFFDAINNTLIIDIEQQVHAMPVPPGPDGQPGLMFLTDDQIPLTSACKNHKLNLAHVSSYGEVDTSSETWEHIKRTVFNDGGIVAPPLGVILPD